MKQCSKCSNLFKGEPFGSHKTEGVFCSIKCLSDGALDQPFALNYIGFVEHFRSFEELPSPTTLSELEEARVSLFYTIEQMQEYVLGDSEGLYYKKAISDLLEKTLIAKNELDAYFTKKKDFHIDFGFHVAWERFRDEESEEVAIGLQSHLQRVIDKFDDKPIILYN